MTTTHPADRAAQPPPSELGPLIEPGRRLDPSPDRDRPWRLAITLVGAAVVLLIVVALALASTATWLSGRGYTDVPAITELGGPEALTLTSATGSVRVLPSGDVDQLTLALVAPGATTLPDADARVPARITESAGAGGTAVEVRQPDRSFDPPWSDRAQDLLLLVPTGLDLSLEVDAEVGDVRIDGDFTAVQAHSDVGGIRLGPLTAPGGVIATSRIGEVDIELGSPAPANIEITSDVGDVDLLLPTDAAGPVAITTDLGNVAVAAPGTARWQVEASSEVGEVRTDPGLTDAPGSSVGTLTVTSEVGDVEISR